MATEPFDVEIFQAVSGSLISKLTIDMNHRAIDIKVALEKASETPARYQKLLLPARGTEGMQDNETLSEVGFQIGETLSVMYSEVEANDFVHAVRDAVVDMSLLRYMVANGADINAKADIIGRLPNLNDGICQAQDKHLLAVAMKQASGLHHAANHGLSDVCHFILGEPSFTEINSLATDGEISMTALHVACLNSHSNICCMLLSDSRFQLISETINEMFARRDALALACQKGLPYVVSMLLKDRRCTSINDITDDYDTTVLMLAACTNTPGNIEVCKLIMNDRRFTRYEESSCRGAGTKLSGTAYDIAKKNGLHEIVRLWDKWWAGQ